MASESVAATSWHSIPQHHARPRLWGSWGGKRQSLSVACGTLHLLISKSIQHRVEGERPCVILLSCFASTLSLSHVWVVAALGGRAGAPAYRCLIEKKTRPRNIFQGICQQGPDMQFFWGRWEEDLSTWRCSGSLYAESGVRPSLLSAKHVLSL